MGNSQPKILASYRTQIRLVISLVRQGKVSHDVGVKICKMIYFDTDIPSRIPKIHYNIFSRVYQPNPQIAQSRERTYKITIGQSNILFIGFHDIMSNLIYEVFNISTPRRAFRVKAYSHPFNGIINGGKRLLYDIIPNEDRRFNRVILTHPIMSAPIPISNRQFYISMVLSCTVPLTSDIILTSTNISLPSHLNTILNIQQTLTVGVNFLYEDGVLYPCPTYDPLVNLSFSRLLIGDVVQEREEVFPGIIKTGIQLNIV